MNLRGKMIPIVELSEVLKSFYPGSHHKATKTSDIIIVVELNSKQLALKVEEIVGQSQVVLKSLSTDLFHLPEVGGVAILGDGRVALVLDMAGLFTVHNSQLREAVA